GPGCARLAVTDEVVRDPVCQSAPKLDPGRVDERSRGFVQHQRVAVFKYNFQGKRFRIYNAYKLRRNQKVHSVAGLYPLRSRGRHTVYQYRITIFEAPDQGPG